MAKRKQIDVRQEKIDSIKAQLSYYRSVSTTYDTRRRLLDIQMKPLVDAIKRLGTDFAASFTKIPELELDLQQAYLEKQEAPLLDKVAKLRKQEKNLDTILTDLGLTPEELLGE